jgi:hypothetical protein
MQETIGWSDEQDDTEWQLGDALLFREATVHRKEHIELAAGALEQLTIPHTGPSPPRHGLDRVADEQPPQIVGEVLIKKDAHRPTPNRARGRVLRWPVRG